MPSAMPMSWRVLHPSLVISGCAESAPKVVSGERTGGWVSADVMRRWIRGERAREEKRVRSALMLVLIGEEGGKWRARMRERIGSSWGYCGGMCGGDWKKPVIEDEGFMLDLEGSRKVRDSATV